MNSINGLDVIGASALGEVIQMLQNGNKEAGKKALIKAGFKGNAAGVAGSLLWTVGKCMAQGNPANGV